MNIKNFVTAIILIMFFALPAMADVVWPALYVARGMLSIKVIILGLIIELFFVKYFTKVDWKQAAKVLSTDVNLSEDSRKMLKILIDYL